MYFNHFFFFAIKKLIHLINLLKHIKKNTDDKIKIKIIQKKKQKNKKLKILPHLIVFDE